MHGPLLLINNRCLSLHVFCAHSEVVYCRASISPATYAAVRPMELQQEDQLIYFVIRMSFINNIKSLIWSCYSKWQKWWSVFQRLALSKKTQLRVLFSLFMIWKSTSGYLLSVWRYNHCLLGTISSHNFHQQIITSPFNYTVIWNNIVDLWVINSQMVSWCMIFMYIYKIKHIMPPFSFVWNSSECNNKI